MRDLGHPSRFQAESVWDAGPGRRLRERVGTFLYQHYTCTVTLQAPLEAMMATYPQAAKEPAARTAVDAPRILAADDQPHILDAIELLLQPQDRKSTRLNSS